MKDHSYRLVDLMMMLRGQQFRGYQGINTLLSIFDDESIDPIRKRLIIISGLEALGLYKIDDEKPITVDILWKRGEGSIHEEIVPSNLFRCHLLDIIVQFDFILN